MTDIEYIAKGLSPKARPYKDGFITCCPAHDDNSPSLVITPGDSEDFTIHCFAGCDWKAVKEAIKKQGLYHWQPTMDSIENWQRGKAKDDFLSRFKAAKAAQQFEEATSDPVDAQGAFLGIGDYMAWAAALPPPEQFCGPFYSHSTGFIAAPGGSGKSMFSLGLAKALASGQPFAGWNTARPLKVFILDCEMSDSGLFGRLRALGYHGKLNITFDTSGLRDNHGYGRFELGNYAHMQYLMATAQQHEVIIIDNVSACLRPAKGVDLFSPEAWQQVFDLEQWARREGKLLIFIDHTNKAGQLAGTLHKHRMADFVMLLERTSLIGEPWLEFLWNMDKCRYDTDPEDVIARLVRLDNGQWTVCDPNEGDDHVYLAVVEGKMTKKDAAEELDITRATLDKRLLKAKLRLRKKQHDRSNDR
jgi:hypothetical protein